MLHKANLAVRILSLKRIQSNVTIQSVDDYENIKKGSALKGFASLNCFTCAF